ncbi:MAG: hemerythrin domain-containing protein [Myxococcales bacterium]
MRHLERRTLLLLQHKQLRERIVEVGEAASNVLACSEGELAGRAAELSRAVITFADDLNLHLAAEEELLGPILERIDAWGPVRLELLRSEHAHQRALLRTLHTDRSLEPRDMARRARSLVADVLVDMNAEEKDLLAEGLLRDDPIVVDQSDC